MLQLSQAKNASVFSSSFCAVNPITSLSKTALASFLPLLEFQDVVEGCGTLYTHEANPDIASISNSTFVLAMIHRSFSCVKRKMSVEHLGLFTLLLGM